MSAAAILRLQNLLSLFISHGALNPVVTGSLLFLLTKSPLQVRQQLYSRISSLQNPQRLAKVLKTLVVLLALGVLRKTNEQFNKVALNAGRWSSEKKRWNLKQEVAVVTGGCSGIGLLIVKGLVKKGVRVAVLDVQQLPATLQGYSSIRFFECDVTDAAAVTAAADRVRAEYGSPSILINNAGIATAHAILDTSPEYLRKIFDVNVLSNWYTVKAFLPDMIAKNKGHIVTVASTASYIAVAGMVDYTATKAAILTFHEGLNQELKLRYNAPKVLTTSVHPNWTQTPLIADYEKALRASGSPIIEPQVVADAVVKQIASVRGGQVFLPGAVSAVSLLRSLPNWFQELFRETISKSILGSLK